MDATDFIPLLTEESKAAPTLLPVVVDHREVNSGVIEALSQIPGVQVTVGHLRLGDYEADGYCLFERKTLLDFAASIKDGRLFSQANRLALSGVPAAIIVEGRLGALAQSGMSRESLQGALVCLSLIYNLPVLRSFDPPESARLMVYAGNQLRRHTRGAVLHEGARPKRKRRVQLRILRGLPGIGPGRAEQLLDHFGSIEAVVAAQATALLEVAGIGEKTAAAIRWAVQADPVAGGLSEGDFSI